MTSTCIYIYIECIVISIKHFLYIIVNIQITSTFFNGQSEQQDSWSYPHNIINITLDHRVQRTVNHGHVVL